MKVKIIYNFGGKYHMALFWYIITITRPKKEFSENQLNKILTHEKCHLLQQRKLIVLWWPIYIINWVLNFFITPKKMYMNVLFEKEARYVEQDESRLKEVTAFSFLKYISKEG